MGQALSKPPPLNSPKLPESPATRIYLTRAKYGKNPEDKELTYADGSKYFGTVENGLPKGFGRMFYATGEYYIGYWLVN